MLLCILIWCWKTMYLVEKPHVDDNGGCVTKFTQFSVSADLVYVDPISWVVCYEICSVPLMGSFLHFSFTTVDDNV